MLTVILGTSPSQHEATFYYDEFSKSNGRTDGALDAQRPSKARRTNLVGVCVREMLVEHASTDRTIYRHQDLKQRFNFNRY